MKTTKIFATAALALSMGMATTFGAAAQVADIDVSENNVVWHAYTGEKMSLSISGPSGDFSYEFGAGEKPAVGVFDKAGNALVDGSYTWELVSVPAVSDAMKAARAAGERVVAHEALKQFGYFTVSGGFFVMPSDEAVNPGAASANKDQVFLDDLIVDGSACIGMDCANGENFGFDTLRLKENNLRIKFDDSSGTGSFPNNDWQLTANDSSNGGANRFSIDDITGGKTPFNIEAGAPNNALYVDDAGNIGIGTATPVVETHITDGDSPTLRLEQDGSSGFGSQTWDIAGNETNFFVRDVTNSSKLPFRIKPGAPTDSLYIAADGDIGLGTDSPDAALNVERSDGSAQVLVTDTTTSSGAISLLSLNTTQASVRPRFTMSHADAGSTWNLDVLNDGNFAFTLGGGSGPVFTFDQTAGNVGNMIIEGNYISGSTALNVPDYVFADDYYLRSLDEVKSFIETESHLPDVPSAHDVITEGLDITEMQLTLLRKVEELTLYTLEQHDTIQKLQERLDSLEGADQE